MKAFATWVMKGRMQAVIAATVLAVLALLVTPLAFISAAVVVLTVLRQGWYEGLLIVLSALLAIAGLGGLLFQMPIGAALVGLLLWVPAAVLGAILGRTGSLRIAIEAAALGAAMVVVLQYLLLDNPAAFWGEILREFLAQRMGAEQVESANLGQVIGLLAGWMPGGVAATWFVAYLGALLLARYWAAMIDRPGAFGEEFRQLRFGRWLLWLAPLLLGLGVIATGGEPSFVGQMYLVSMLVFVVQGLSVGHALAKEYEASPAWLLGLYLILVFVAPQGATMIALAGYADGWLDFRARARARRSGTGDD